MGSSNTKQAFQVEEDIAVLERDPNAFLERLRGMQESVVLDVDVVSDLYKKKPRVLISLIETLGRSISDVSTSHHVIELLSSVLVGLFASNPDDSFVDSLFFNGETKICLGCGASILDLLWRVCPFCEKRIERSKNKDGSILAIEIASNLMSMCLGNLAPGSKWNGDEAYDHAHLVVREKAVNCVLVFLSQVLTASSKKLSSRVFNRWLDAVLQQAHSAEFFVGVLSVALKPVVAGWLSFSEDKRESLRRSCLNLSLILLSGRIASEKSYSNATADADDMDKNFALDFIRQVPVSMLLEAVIQMVSSDDLFPWGLGILWNAIQSAEFFDLLVLNCARVMIPLLSFIATHKSDVKFHGTINLAVFIFLSLSSRRQFAVALNNRIGAEAKRLPKSPLEKEANASVADALFVIVDSIISGQQIEALHECLLMVMCNISPYQKTLSMTSSVALMRLFVLFASKQHLLKSEKSHELLNLVLDCISNTLQYQYEGNRPLTYAVVSYRDRFYRLFEIMTNKELTVEEFCDGKKNVAFATQEWFDGWRKAMPAKVIARVLDELVPLLERIKATEAEAVMRCISGTTIVGVLPPAPPILIRRSLRSKDTDVWIATYLWSVVFNASPFLSMLEPVLFQQS